MKIFIVGGGFLGQLLHTIVPEARVFDWRAEPPSRQNRDFGPQYLWEPVPGLPYKEFKVLTSVDGNPPTPESILSYKRKVGKHLDNADWLAQFQPVMAGYDVILPESRVEYGKRIVAIDRMLRTFQLADGSVETYDVLISTIPLYALVSLAGLRLPEPFINNPIYVRTLKDVFVSDGHMHVDYIGYEDTPVYRIVDRGNERHFESLEPFGAGPSTKLIPGKIHPHPEAELAVESFRVNYSIYCFGRYGAWRPEELAHQTYREAVKWLLSLQA